MRRERTASIQSVAAAADDVHPSFVVIGCGNTLRGDDALGPQVAQLVEAWHLPGVAAVAVHQLAPEIAAALAAYDHAIFVDARHATPTDASANGSVRVEVVKPTLHDTAQTHVASPNHVLALTQALYGHCPQSWLVSVPAQGFDLGAPLSAAAAHGRNTALLVVRSIITIQRGRHA